MDRGSQNKEAEAIGGLNNEAEKNERSETQPKIPKVYHCKPFIFGGNEIVMRINQKPVQYNLGLLYKLLSKNVKR